MAADTSLSLGFPALGGREVTARFDGGDITSDGGALLVARADRKLGLVDAMAAEIVDGRQAAKVKHSLATVLRQRVVAIACGYEDANDFDRLASDPAIKIACQRAPKSDPNLASQPTISRLENRLNRKDIYCMGVSIGRVVIQQLPRKSKRILLDIDAYEDPCHGQQELECFNGHYGSHCFLPLALFITGRDGVQRLLGAVLRSGTAGNAGVRAVIRLAVELIRERFPHARIVLRGDAAYGNDQVLRLCDKLHISYCLGQSTNKRLRTLSTPAQIRACLLYTFDKEK